MMQNYIKDTIAKLEFSESFSIKIYGQILQLKVTNAEPPNAYTITDDTVFKIEAVPLSKQ